MAGPKKKLHLAQFLVHGPSYHSLAMWRHPLTAEANYDWRRPELYQHIARVCERGLFDMVFFADLNYISDTYLGSLEPALRYAAQAPEHDPIPLLSWMGAVTRHIGLAATFSVSHHHPFYAARLWASLDHLTGGRVGWNVVTSINHNQAANHGEVRADADQRYDRAHEFIEVCRKLWDSWDDDALVMDRDAAEGAAAGGLGLADDEVRAALALEVEGVLEDLTLPHAPEIELLGAELDVQLGVGVLLFGNAVTVGLQVRKPMPVAVGCCGKTSPH